MVGHVGISDQFAIMLDVARQIRARLGAGAVGWDVFLVTPSGVVRMIGYRR
jgi:hypothetical protein